MSSPSDPRPPADTRAPGQPSTQEIPVVPPAAAPQPLPPHPGATTPAPVQTARSTGPLDFVPGFSGPPPPAPAAPAPPPPAPTPTPTPTAEQGTGATSVWPDSLQTGPVPLSEPNRTEEKSTSPRDRSTLLGTALVVAALVLLQLGLALDFGGESFWSDIPLWSAFATACVVLGLAGFAAVLPGGRRLSGGAGWRIAAGGLVGLAVFWLLVVLPVVAGDRGFLLTAALGCFGAALWTGPARRR